MHFVQNKIKKLFPYMYEIIPYVILERNKCASSER